MVFIDKNVTINEPRHEKSCFCPMRTTKAPEHSRSLISPFVVHYLRAQPRGRSGRNNRPRGRNFALNWAQGEVGVSLNYFFRNFIKSFHKQAVIAI